MAFLHKEDLTLLYRLLIKPFYEENGGLLSVILFVCFGFFDSVSMMVASHAGIMHDICANPLALGATMLVWLAYAFKISAFVLQALRKPENECLYVMGLAAKNTAWVTWSFIYLVLSLPVTGYAALTVWVGFKSGLYVPAIDIVLFHLFLIIAWSALFTTVQRQAHRRFNIPWRLTFPFSFPLHYSLYFGSELVQNRKLMLIVTKVISLLILWGGFYLMRVQELDVRFGLMCMVGAMTTHLNIVRKLREHEDNTMGWIRNVPIAPFTRFLSYLFFFALLFVPELFLVLKQIGTLLEWYEPLLFWAVGVAGLSYYHVLLFKKGMYQEKYMNHVFVFWLLFTFSIQFKLPPLAVSLLVLGQSYWQYTTRFYQYEGVQIETEQ